VTTFGPYKATVAVIHDGDTIDVDLVLIPHIGHLTRDHDLGFNVHRAPAGVLLERQSVRLYGCNAPELRTAAGKESLAYLQTLLKVGDEITLLSHGWDKYGGRIDGQVTLADGRDLVTVMIAAGQAKAWDGVGVKPT
jgi:endonuclease YncB( thermonuclease family)